MHATAENTKAFVPQYALKIERSPDVRTVRQECKTLRRLQQCAQICKARGSGTYGDRFYMVLDLLGNNLVEARRSVQGSRLDLSTAKVCWGIVIVVQSISTRVKTYRWQSGTAGAWRVHGHSAATRCCRPFSQCSIVRKHQLRGCDAAPSCEAVPTVSLSKVQAGWHRDRVLPISGQQCVG